MGYPDSARLHGMRIFGNHLRGRTGSVSDFRQVVLTPSTLEDA